MTQNNRANRLSEIATLPGEDRRARLLQALDAYDDALRFRRPENAPLDYATTQINLSLLFTRLASLQGGDRLHYLVAGFASAQEGARFFQALHHAPYARSANDQLRQTIGEIITAGKELAQTSRWHELLNLADELDKALPLEDRRDAVSNQEDSSAAQLHNGYGILRDARTSYHAATASRDDQISQAVATAKSVSVLFRELAGIGRDKAEHDYARSLGSLELAREIDRETGRAFHLAQWVRDVTGVEFVELEDADEWSPRVAHLVHLAARYERDENWEGAIGAYQQACELAGTARSDKELARSAEVGFRLALCLKQAGRWTEALKQQETNVAAYKKLDDVMGKANAYMEIGHIYQMMNLYDPALLYYGEAYYLYRQAAEEAGDEDTRQTTRRGMANAKESLGNLEFQLKLLPGGMTDLEEARALYLDLGMPGKAAIIARTLEDTPVMQGGRHA